MNYVSEAILESLQDLVFHPYRLIYGSVPKDVARSRVNVAVHRLIKKGYLEKSLVEDQICLKLTELGASSLNFQQSKQLLININSHKKWDGLWRVVVFDIPETNRRIRDALRLGLKSLEFKQLQKSVWISKVDCLEELRQYVRNLGLSEYVLVFETRNIS